MTTGTELATMSSLMSAYGSRAVWTKIDSRDEHAKYHGKPEDSHSLHAHRSASGNPVKAALRLASLGLDWAPPRRRRHPQRRECLKAAWQKLCLTKPAFSWKP